MKKRDQVEPLVFEANQTSMEDMLRNALKKVLDGAERKWKSDDGKLWVVKKGEFFYIATIHFHLTVFKYKMRRDKWIWVSLEDVWGREWQANDKEVKNYVKTALALRKHLEKIQQMDTVEGKIDGEDTSELS